MTRSIPPSPCPPPNPRRPSKIPDTLDGPALNVALGARLRGTPADGSASPSEEPDKVIWVDRGDEVLVHLDSLSTRILDRMVLVSVDLETDQTGRTPLVVALAVGNADDPAGLVAVTDQLPRGNGLLAARWGETVQAAVWASFLSLAADHATERSATPHGFSAVRGALSLHAGPELKAAALNLKGISR